MKPFPIRLPSGRTINIALLVQASPEGPDAVRLVMATVPTALRRRPLELVLRGADAEALDAAIGRLIDLQL